MLNSITFRYTRESSDSVIRLMTTDQAQKICQSHVAIMLGEAILSCKIRMQDTCSRIRSNAMAFVGIWLIFRQHSRILSIFLESHYDSSGTAHLPIAFGAEILYVIANTLVRQWGAAHLFLAKLQHLLALGGIAGAQERLEYISIWPIDHCIFANPCVNKVCPGNNMYMCQNLRHWRTYSWQSHSFC